MKFIRIGQNGDYVYTETINGQKITVRIGVAKDKKDARQKAKKAFAELKGSS